MLSAGGHVPTHTVAPASASAFAIAKPNPPSSATPATSARLPVRSIESMAACLADFGAFHKVQSEASSSSIASKGSARTLASSRCAPTRSHSLPARR